MLRFPRCPRGLQLGLLRTLAEEQHHCRLYLERVAVLSGHQGAEVSSSPWLFGTPPLSGYLWQSLRAIRAAPEPLLAFLCGIGLTFEAANLDHTMKHRSSFELAGDEASAAVLQRVHDDEIRHVRLARVWLRRLARAGPRADDADLYAAHAAFPPFELHKARGRPALALEARRRAGLSERLVAEVLAATRRPSPGAAGPGAAPG
mmetsp:Transcript_95846/g.270980  ORF Transcript_95846/g.270980 Transcript_95846/m.270980 type:complete len:204 (+) Transcript_95846:490-1101(+)